MACTFMTHYIVYAIAVVFVNVLMLMVRSSSVAIKKIMLVQNTSTFVALLMVGMYTIHSADYQ